MKPLAAALPSVMGKIVLAAPLRELLRLPDCEGNPAAKRDIARELRAQADRFEADLPAVGSSATRLAAALLRELAADCDRTALARARADAAAPTFAPVGASAGQPAAAE